MQEKKYMHMKTAIDSGDVGVRILCIVCYYWKLLERMSTYVIIGSYLKSPKYEMWKGTQQ